MTASSLNLDGMTRKWKGRCYEPWLSPTLKYIKNYDKHREHRDSGCVSTTEESSSQPCLLVWNGDLGEIPRIGVDRAPHVMSDD